MGSFRGARPRPHTQIHGQRIWAGMMEFGGDRHLLRTAFLRNLVRRNAEGRAVVLVHDRNQQGLNRHGGRAVGADHSENLRTLHQSVCQRLIRNYGIPLRAYPLSPIQSNSGDRTGNPVISGKTNCRGSRQGRKQTSAIRESEGKRSRRHSARQLNFDWQFEDGAASYRLRH